MKYTKLALFVSLFILSCTALDSSLIPGTEMHKCLRVPGLAVDCSTEFTGVCAFYIQRPNLRFVQRYTANGCIACNDESVKFYQEGTCQGNKVNCDVSYRPSSCTKDYNPVCAYTKGSDGIASRKTAGNDCSACSDTTVDYYIRGECPQGSY